MPAPRRSLAVRCRTRYWQSANLPKQLQLVEQMPKRRHLAVGEAKDRDALEGHGAACRWDEQQRPVGITLTRYACNRFGSRNPLNDAGMRSMGSESHDNFIAVGKQVVDG